MNYITFSYLTLRSEKLHVNAILRVLYFLRPMEAPCILGMNTVSCMDGKGRHAIRKAQRGSHKQAEAGRQVSLEGRTHLHNNHIFFRTQNLTAEN
jgi:hypothetical protein